MHLNNKGWGTGQMIVMTLFLLILLGISWYYISSVFNGELVKNAVTVKDGYYDTVKKSLRSSAEKYYYDNNYSGQAILSYNLLREKGYISNIHDFLDFSCTGYVIANNNEFKPYIRCNDYTSDGYVKDFE